MIVVSNTGPIIALLKVELLDLLKHYFKEVCLSPATYHELTEKGKNKLGAELIRNSSWIKVKEHGYLMMFTRKHLDWLEKNNFIHSSSFPQSFPTYYTSPPSLLGTEHQL